MSNDVALHAWRILSLCAGVGGLDLGVRLAEPEARSVCYVEREAAAAAILVARMEDGWLHPAPIWSDLATFDAGAWRGAVDCVVSGDPCQPNSVAGRGLGDADERWLADRVVDTFDRSGARRLFRENVPGNADGQLAYFVPALERLGCRIAVGLFSAKELGFAHGRERMFIMADRDGVARRIYEAGRHDEAEASYGGAALDDAASGRCRNLGLASAEDGSRPRLLAGGQLASGSEGSGERVADAASGRRVARAQEPARRIIGIQGSGRAALAGDGGCELVDADRQNSQGRWKRGDATGRQKPNGYARLAGGGMVPLLTPGPADPRWPDIIARAPHLEPAVRRMAHGMADRVDRLRACGNGVVPLVAGYAWRNLEARLAEADDGLGRAV